MKIKLIIFFIALLIIIPAVTFSAGLYNLTKDEIFQAFRYYKNISPDISLPTVLEIPFEEDSFKVPVFAVYNISDSDFEPYYFSVKEISTPARVETLGGVGNSTNINDRNYATYLEFPVMGETNKAIITFNFDKAIEASSLYFALDNYVAFPQTISINAIVDGKDYVVQREVKPQGGDLVFPKTRSKTWTISFSYVQPLRISELKINDLSQVKKLTGLRFLAQKGKSYKIYFDADRYVTSSVKESGDLSSNVDVVRYTLKSEDILNPNYKPADYDSDSVPDLADNCVSVPNPDQKDSNLNFLGDACEDYDRDGVVNGKDNCEDVPNSAQTDTDDDGIGDICDTRDNRATERMPWLPWVGIGVAGIVIFGLFALVLMKKKDENL